VVGYLVFDVLVLWCAFLAVNAHPVPGFPTLIMAFIIGALGGSHPLPAAAGTIGGMTGMLILYGVAAHATLAAVLLHQAIGLLVPLTGGAIAYTILRHRFGPCISEPPAIPAPRKGALPAGKSRKGIIALVPARARPSLRFRLARRGRD
jgi:hypothetical protein